MRIKNNAVTFRLTNEQDNIIKGKAKRAKMSLTEYLITVGLEREISAVEGLKPLLYELNLMIGSLERLTFLAENGKLREVNLTEARELLEKNYNAVHELIRKTSK